ncbi:histidine kinase [Coraliomargarita sinensis]|uniref:Histidine kinase n=1 Tax=Coraliomargarita sinensis TaxID=2174842 RepID=A0A317ZHR2_9BACT|nr:CBS domain-containing protein [Coraliomargarita sinensis]PXA05010.1 histidine kinase [Coraliomargarita sinensis]
MPLKKVNVTILLKEKGTTVFWISDDATVDSAVAEMNRHRVGAVLVKSDGKVVGIFTERDVLTRIIASGRDPKTTTIREVMTVDYQSITKETSIEDAMQLMTDKRVRHLPVLEGQEAVGMISIGDITRWLLKVNEMEAENLRRYIFDEYPG